MVAGHLLRFRGLSADLSCCLIQRRHLVAAVDFIGIISYVVYLLARPLYFFIFSSSSSSFSSSTSTSSSSYSPSSSSSPPQGGNRWAGSLSQTSGNYFDESQNLCKSGALALTASRANTSASSHGTGHQPMPPFPLFKLCLQNINNHVILK